MSTANASMNVMDDYKNLRNCIERQTKYKYALYQGYLETNITRDPRSFWSFLQTESENHCIRTEGSYINKSFSNAQDIANVFAHFFSTAYEEQSKVNTENTSGNFSFSRVTEETVRSCIKKLKPTKIVGTDSVTFLHF